MATSLTNLKLGQPATTPGPQDMFGAALQLGSATSTVIEYHGNYKEMASNQDNLSAAVLVQVSPTTTRNNLVTPSHSHSLSLPIMALWTRWTANEINYRLHWSSCCSCVIIDGSFVPGSFINGCPLCLAMRSAVSLSVHK